MHAGNLLVPQEPFELLVRRAIQQLLGPSLACKEAVYEEMLRIAEQACQGGLQVAALAWRTAGCSSPLLLIWGAMLTAWVCSLGLH